MDVQFLARQVKLLNARVMDFLRNQSGLWAAFQPTGFEPDIRESFERLTRIQWAFPRVVEDSMQFLRPHPPTVFMLNKWGIMEPDPQHSDLVSLENLQGLLVPGLVFDAHCNRLGRGGGYYDRTLARLQKQNPNVIKIGIAYDRQVHDKSLPVEPFDIPMDWLVTESRCFQRDRGADSTFPDLLSERKLP